nr:nephrin-like [Cherax quadricarinatus]
MVLLVKPYQASELGSILLSYDTRSGVYSRPKEWADPLILGERAHFSMSTLPAALVLNQTRRSDQAVYRCRVDYKRRTTTHARINLTVIEPVESVRIVDESGIEVVGVAGPYTVGERPSLTCQVLGGDPPPTVTWWKNGHHLDSPNQASPNEAHVTSAISTRVGDEPGSVAVNTIHLRALKKEDLRSTYTCKADNHELAPTKEAAVELDMNYGPERVEVRGLDGPVSAGRQYQVVCEAKGSRPPATLTWWLNGHMKKGVSQMTSRDVNDPWTSSTLELVVSPQDEGSKLVCRAENLELPAKTMESTHQLQVLYSPEVQVAAGSSLDLNNIKEGDDVYFDCHIKARPDALKISWSFNGVEMHQNVSAGVMVVGRSLVLQKVSRKQAGNYTCAATNTQGANTSSPILLSVKCESMVENQPSSTEPRTPRPTLDRASHTRPTLDRASHTRPTLDRASHTRPTLDRASHTRPTLDRASHTRPTLDRASHTRPTLDRASHTRPTLDRASHTRPTLDRASHTRPTLDRASHTRPTLDRASHTRPTLDRASHTRPTLDRASQNSPNTRPSLAHPAQL